MSLLESTTFTNQSHNYLLLSSDPELWRGVPVPFDLMLQAFDEQCKTYEDFVNFIRPQEQTLLSAAPQQALAEVIPIRRELVGINPVEYIGHLGVAGC